MKPFLLHGSAELRAVTHPFLGLLLEGPFNYEFVESVLCELGALMDMDEAARAYEHLNIEVRYSAMLSPQSEALLLKWLHDRARKGHVPKYISIVLSGEVEGIAYTHGLTEKISYFGDCVCTLLDNRQNPRSWHKNRRQNYWRRRCESSVLTP